MFLKILNRGRSARGFVVCFAGRIELKIYMSIGRLEFNSKLVRFIQTSCICHGPFPGRIGVNTPSVVVIVSTIRAGIPHLPSFFRFLDSCPTSTIDVTDSSGSESEHYLGADIEGA